MTRKQKAKKHKLCFAALAKHKNTHTSHTSAHTGQTHHNVSLVLGLRTARASADMVMCMSAPVPQCSTGCSERHASHARMMQVIRMMHSASQWPAAFSWAMSDVPFRSSANLGTAPSRAIASLARTAPTANVLHPKLATLIKQVN